MKKIIFTLLLLLLTSCNNLNLVIELPEDDIIEVAEEQTTEKNNITNISKQNSKFNKKDLNIQVELFQWRCQDNYKEWINKTYGFSMCLPDNWNAISAYSGRNEEFHDYIEEIWEPIMNKNSFKTKIHIWNNNRLDIIDGYWYWITDPLITKIEWNKLYIDGFERLEWNNLVYKWSLLFINSWSNIVSFYYNKNNEEHKKIITSIETF